MADLMEETTFIKAQKKMVARDSVKGKDFLPGTTLLRACSGRPKHLIVLIYGRIVRGVGQHPGHRPALVQRHRGDHCDGGQCDDDQQAVAELRGAPRRAG